MATITSLLFDFGGTLDGPAHWLDRFLSSYRAAAIEMTRAELDPAFDDATRIGYGATRVVTRFGLTDLVRFLVGHQFEYLRKSGPVALRTKLDESGAAGRHRLVEGVTNSFVRETVAGLAHSREVVGALKSRFKLGIVSNFYGNLDKILAEAKLESILRGGCGFVTRRNLQARRGHLRSGTEKNTVRARVGCDDRRFARQGLRARAQTGDAHRMAAHRVAKR